MATNNQQTPILSNELNQTQQNPQQQSLEETLIAYRQTWVDEIEKMNEMMKSLPKVDELLNTIYTNSACITLPLHLHGLSQDLKRRVGRR